MPSSRSSAVAWGVVAALLWSPHAALVERLSGGGAAPSRLVVSLYLLVGAALCLALLLLVMGRLGELRLFNRRESECLLLGLLGGFGFWLLRAMALGTPGAGLTRLFFSAAPLCAALGTAVTRERGDRRALFGLVLGFIGCALLLVPGTGGRMGGAAGLLLGLGAGACWALFWLVARPTLQQEGALPLAALVTALGAGFLLVTCLSMGERVLDIRPGTLAGALGAGAVTVGLMAAAWLRCLAGLPVAHAAGLWYLGVVFSGPVCYWLGLGPRPAGWWLLGGAALVLMGVHHALSGRRSQSGSTTLSDIIRRG